MAELVTDESARLKGLLARWDSLELEGQVLFHRWEGNGKTWLQYVVPQSKIPDILREIHDSASGGHFGMQKTLDKARLRFYWPGMVTDIKEWCHTCTTCKRYKGPGKRSPAPLQKFSVGAPFERLGVDILGPLPQSNRGNRYLLVITDYFTRWPEAVPMPNQEAKTIADALLVNVFCQHGLPLEIHTDQGRNFESELLKEVASVLGIRRTRTTPMHPQSAGQVERLNRSIKDYLGMFVSQHQKDWDDKVPLFLLAYRSAPHTATKMSPAQLVYGRELRLPIDLETGARPGATLAGEPYAVKLRENIEAAHEFARNQARISVEAQNKRYNLRAQRPEIEAEDLVWVYNPIRKKGLCPKLQAAWTGPWKVLKRINDVIYRVKMRRGTRVLHADRLALVRHGLKQQERFPEGGSGVVETPNCVANHDC